MKVFSVQRNSTNFNGMASYCPTRSIRNAKDAISQWEMLKHPKYTNIFQESEYATKRMLEANKEVRNHNFAFLDELKNTLDKKMFIEHFKQVTGFPVLKESTQRIVGEFKRVLGVAAALMGASDKDILVSGYDKFCSVGLKTALPGSDMDKGFAVVRGPHTDSIPIEESYSLEFKGRIWDNIDNRIMSVNHCAAFPNIVTDKEIILKLNKYDEVTGDLVNPTNYHLYQRERMYNNNPVSGAKYNIWLSQRLENPADKVDAKNFAYVIEAIRDGKRDTNDIMFLHNLFQFMNNSKFATCSNVTQTSAMNYKYQGQEQEVMKPKLKARLDMEKNFDSMSIDKQYELVKDVIRSMSGDNQNPEFSNIFDSKTDRHRLLINDILSGDVDCAFDFPGNGRELTHLFFNKNVDKFERYGDLNVYDRN